VFSFHSVSVFMFTVYCLMDPCRLISNKDDDDCGEMSFINHKARRATLIFVL